MAQAQMQSLHIDRRRLAGRFTVGLVIAAVLAGCASSNHRAPVESRGDPGRGSAAASAGATTPTPGALEAAKQPPGAENAGKPGYYTVRPGDTILRIGLDAGQNWRDVARWNNLENPNVIEAGQVLRVVPPEVDAAAVVPRGVSLPKVESRPLDARPAAVAASGTASGAAASASAAVQPPPREADALAWSWPAGGAVIAPFDEVRNKGLAIAGKAGDAVLAAADGRVVYAGSGLRGYGNLVIVKHNNTYLSAYAHNQTLLVKEDQAVRRGQKIAEMGSSDTERVKLHFEIRREGKPVDPARLLPAR